MYIIIYIQIIKLQKFIPGLTLTLGELFRRKSLMMSIAKSMSTSRSCTSSRMMCVQSFISFILISFSSRTPVVQYSRRVCSPAFLSRATCSTDNVVSLTSLNFNCCELQTSKILATTDNKNVIHLYVYSVCIFQALYLCNSKFKLEYKINESI